MKRYRVDVFDRSFNFVDMAQTSQPTLITDVLVQSSSTFEVPKELNVSKGDYCQVKGDDSLIFQGIVTDFAYDGKITSVTLAQMSKLLDVDVFADVSTLIYGVEPWMKAQIEAVYDGTDTAQNLTGLTVTASTTTPGQYDPNDQQIYNLYNMAVHFFKIYGIVIDVGFDVMAKKVTFAFRKIDVLSAWKIETKLKDVSEYSISSPSLNEYPNKMIIRNQEDPNQSVTYYWHPTEFSGTVDQDGSYNRVQPVVSRCSVITPQQGQTFDDAAYIEAVNAMYQSRYDDQIEIVFNADSKLVEVGKIGQCYSIIDRGKTYNTILTGYQRLNDKYTRMTFGYVRTRLTQILQQERRKG